MAKKITGFQRYMAVCPLPNIIMFIILNIKILLVVAKGHGGTR